MQHPTPVDPATWPKLAALALVLAAVPLAWWWVRHRGADRRRRLSALTALTLFLTFDLIVFGAFTRLTDSGLGCPDWPGCYSHASPFGAQAHIEAAEAALPSGPVTTTKAWIEMLHRYLAMTVGALIVVLTAASWAARRALPHSPWWSVATLAWVIGQGLLGKYTVTLKLYPAFVTLHLLGGLLLLALLAIQRESYRRATLDLDRPRLALAVAACAAVFVQAALGGWVSSNYAVLACSGFPTCNGAWWPPMDFDSGFTVLRDLGRHASGDFLPFDALVAIHFVHRAFAVVALAALVALALALRSCAPRFAAALAGLAVWQLASGLGNVLLDWPLAAALAHSAGAAGLVLVLTLLLARARLGSAVAVAPAARVQAA